MKKSNKMVALLAVAVLTAGSATLAYAADKETDKTIYDGTKNNHGITESKDGEAGDVDKTVGGSNGIANSKDGEAGEVDKTIGNTKGIADSKDGEAGEVDKVIGGTKNIADSNGKKDEAKKEDKKEYKDLEVTSKYLYSSKGVDVGVYPVITGADKLNERIAMDLLKILQGEGLPESYREYDAAEGKASIVQYATEDDFNSSYEAPENFDRYAKVSIKLVYRNSVGKLEPETIILEYYVDKDTMKDMTKAEFDKAMEEIEKAKEKEEEAKKEEEEAKKEEVILVPVRVVAEKLGFKVLWNDATKLAGIEGKVLGKTVKVEFKADENKYIIDGKKEMELEIAPTLVDGVMQVPSTVFSNFFGYALTVDAEGIVATELTEKEIKAAQKKVAEYKKPVAKEEDKKEEAKDTDKKEEKADDKKVEKEDTKKEEANKEEKTDDKKEEENKDDKTKKEETNK